MYLKVKMQEGSNDKEFVECPESENKLGIPLCRKTCDKFKGYKTVKDQRYLLCSYK